MLSTQHQSSQNQWKQKDIHLAYTSVIWKYLVTTSIHKCKSVSIIIIETDFHLWVLVVTKYFEIQLLNITLHVNHHRINENIETRLT